ncbi:putative tam domain methyltransferase protein [Neofusicoccum parvum UCRNP2]|uniref:Putative tam domain methyltransferase protein n=1 Tax=Botryosphaeria parva (strain UCR-NP2) TaxID=1287680 RepID=R1EG94_BOTPV|nr:putative tam domain methyltransferase protein [Neofusicoccum parvum UCRNP2]
MGDATAPRPASRASSLSIHSTRSLLSTDLTHVVENGRTYPNDTYFMPCDGLEQTRLEILHRLYLAALDGALTTAPLAPGTQRILDVGTGPGEWASQMAEQFPDAEIVAVDLAVWELPARDVESDADSDDSSDPKANIIWEIDDLEPYESSSSSNNSSTPHSPVGPSSPSLKAHIAQAAADMDGLAIDQGYASGSTDKTPSEPHSLSEAVDGPSALGEHSDDDDHDHDDHAAEVDDGWNFSEPFDFVHLRDLKGAFRDWRAVYRQAFVNLAPGGLIEVVDLMPDFSSAAVTPDDDTPSPQPQPQSALMQLVDATIAAARAARRPISLDHLDAKELAAAGFTDVRRTVVDVPMGPWPDDERRHVMGKMWLVCCAEGLEASCLRLLTRSGGWEVERVRGLARRAREEILEGRHGGIVTQLWFVTARKARRRGR